MNGLQKVTENMYYEKKMDFKNFCTKAKLSFHSIFSAEFLKSKIYYG